MVSPAIDRLVEEMGAHPQVSRLWLFGSRDRSTWIARCDVAEEADTLLRIDRVRLDQAPELADRIRRIAILG